VRDVTKARRHQKADWILELSTETGQWALGSAPCRRLPWGAAASPALFCLGAVAEVQMG